MQIIYDEDFIISEPCLSCEKSYVEDIWFETFCDEKECIHIADYLKELKRIEKSKEMTT